MELNGKVALVTGAARRVGRAIAEAFAARGAAVAIHFNRSRGEADDAVARLVAAGGRARAFAADLARVADIERLVGEVASGLGRLDVLVNSASVFYRRPLFEVTEADWDLALDTNLKAPFFLARHAAPVMRRAGAGKIVNIGDWAGIRPYRHYLPYTVSKSGLIGLTRVLAKELAPEIQVNCVALGPVAPPEDFDPEEVRKMTEATLTKRIGSPADVARAVLFFCEGTDFATGATLLLDGGRLIA